ncbi:AI-2E family transporter, partial [archaeon]
MDNQIQRYVVIKTVISAGQGLLVFFILSYILNVRMAHLFGVLHFFMNYIPTAGPIIATFVPLPIVILDPDLGITAKIAAFAAPTAVHMLVGNCMEPMVFGSSMELHPVTILLSLALWYALWGIPGAILAVPITGTSSSHARPFIMPSVAQRKITLSAHAVSQRRACARVCVRAVPCVAAVMRIVLSSSDH